MKTVGEWVGRVPFGLSLPRGASAPPQTVTPGSAALIASYVCASSVRYAGAAASEPSGLNWGSQKRLRFGSLPTITLSMSGTARTSAAAYCVNWERASGVSGVVFDPGEYTD